MKKTTTDRIKKIWAEAKLKKSGEESKSKPVADAKLKVSGSKLSMSKKNISSVKSKNMTESVGPKGSVILAKKTVRIRSARDKRSATRNKDEYNKIEELRKLILEKDDRIKGLMENIVMLRKKSTAYEAKLKSLDKTLVGKDKEIADCKKLFKEAHSAAQLHEADAMKMKNEIKNRDKEIVRFRNTIMELEAASKLKISGLKKTIEDAKKNSTEKDAAWEAVLSEKKVEAKKQEDVIKRLKKDLDLSCKESLERAKKIKETKDVMTVKEREITELKKNVNDLELSINNDEAVKGRDREIAELKADIIWLKELNEALKAHDAVQKDPGEIASLKELVAVQRQYIKELEAAEVSMTTNAENIGS